MKALTQEGGSCCFGQDLFFQQLLACTRAAETSQGNVTFIQTRSPIVLCWQRAARGWASCPELGNQAQQGPGSAPHTQHCPRTAEAKEKGSGDKLSLKKCCSSQSHSSLVFPECSQVPFGALLLGKRAFKGNPTFSIHNLCPHQLCVMSQALFSAPGTVTEPFLSSCSPAALSPSTGTCCSSSRQTWFTHSCWQPAAEDCRAGRRQLPQTRLSMGFSGLWIKTLTNFFQLCDASQQPRSQFILKHSA